VVVTEVDEADEVVVTEDAAVVEEVVEVCICH
jgi:hypothetical protein